MVYCVCVDVYASIDQYIPVYIPSGRVCAVNIGGTCMMVQMVYTVRTAIYHLSFFQMRDYFVLRILLSVVDTVTLAL